MAGLKFEPGMGVSVKDGLWLKSRMDKPLRIHDQQQMTHR